MFEELMEEGSVFGRIIESKCASHEIDHGGLYKAKVKSLNFVLKVIRNNWKV